MSKSQFVLDHLESLGSITSWEAIQEYGATRLSSIIYNLRKKGYKINTETIKFTDRYGRTAMCAKYVLVK